jgi:hypothetical protein
MDMIYADANLEDVGVLQDYSFDMEYGIGDKDTNTFTCKIQKYNLAIQGDNPITQDFVLYVENTEYGGIVDRVESDTKTGVITLSGRTWHGILNSFIIEPPTYNPYQSYHGTITQVLTQMILSAGLSQFFVVENGSNVSVGNFQVRYEPVYDAMMRMLQEYNCKLKTWYKNGKVHIMGVISCNYATNEEFDSSQVPFKVGITYNNINHMICLGQGDGVKRAVIHLFTDDNGVVQPYIQSNVKDPIQDSDYILDKRKKVMMGLNERTYVYDYPNAEITYNYPLLTSEPKDWKSDYYKKYYVKDKNSGNETYKLIDRVFKDELRLLKTEPKDWSVRDGYKKYYTVNAKRTESYPVTKLQEDDPACKISYLPENGKVGEFWDWTQKYADYYEYDSLEGDFVHVPAQRLTIKDNHMAEKPIDWDWHYSYYNTREWNGTEWEYHEIGLESVMYYELLEERPVDLWGAWDEIFVKVTEEMPISHYFKVGDYISVRQALQLHVIMRDYNNPDEYGFRIRFKKNMFYVRKWKLVPPAFPEGGVYYTTYKSVAPPWQDNRYYKRVVDNTPRFRKPDPSHGFYGYWELVKDVEQIPKFVRNTYHYETVDRMKVLVADAIKKLSELRDTSTLKIDLELEAQYDVGDIVGSIDEVTKIKVNKPILRKTIKIKKDIVTVSHEVE